MTQAYEIEVVRKVFDNGCGECVTVGPDSDCLLVEIDGGTHYGGRIVLPPEHALKLTEAIVATAREMIARAAA